MTCPHCQAPFAVKTKFLAKTCGCDEDERFVSFEDWYTETFKLELQESKILRNIWHYDVFCCNNY